GCGRTVLGQIAIAEIFGAVGLQRLRKIIIAPPPAERSVAWVVIDLPDDAIQSAPAQPQLLYGALHDNDAVQIGPERRPRNRSAKSGRSKDPKPRLPRLFDGHAVPAL